MSYAFLPSFQATFISCFPPKYVSVSTCTVWCSHHQLTIQSFCPTVTYTFYSLTSDLLSSHPQSHWKCLPVFLAVSLLAPLSYLSRFLLLVSFFLFPLSLVYFLCLVFVSPALEIENFLSSLPHGPFQHKVESWTAVSKSVFDMAHWSSVAGTTLISHLRRAVYGQEFKFSAMSL